MKKLILLVALIACFANLHQASAKNMPSRNSLTVAPTISSFSPASGAVGTLVTINGSSLDLSTSVSIGSVNAIIISNTSTTLVGMVMPGATTGGLSVTTSGGTATSSGNFTVTQTPYPGSQQGTKLVGTGATGGAYQGQSVAVSADGNTAIVGGYYDNTGVGAAWVYTRSGGVWSQQGAKLVGIGAVGTYVYQGISVSISADGNTAIVGGRGDNNNIGAAWVYTRSGGVWSQQGAKLVGTGSVGSNPYQGWSVSLSADGNTAMVGGYNDNSLTGAAWVYTRNGGVWSQQGAKLVGTGATGNSGQGVSVSLSADGNTATVGGSFDDSNKGAAWVYTRSSGVWSQQGAKLVGTGATGNAGQGNSVSLSADGNTAIVGGSSDNSSAGASWVYTRSGGVWSQQGAKLVGTGAPGAVRQGNSVSLSADGNTAMVGGPNDNNGTGTVWAYTRSGGVWSQQGTKLVGTGVTGSSYQGQSVSLSADGSTAMVGGYNDNSAVGAVWAFNPALPPTITSFSPATGPVGTLVTITGSNLDLATSVSIGSVNAIIISNTGTTLVGMVMPGTVTGGISVTTNGGTATASGNFTVTPTPYPASQQGAKLVGTGDIAANQGQSVAVSADGNTAIVGGYQDNSGVGAAWVYTRSGGVWSQQGAKLVGTGYTGTSYQGFSVSINADGNTAIVGGYLDNNNIGAAWVYTRSGGVWLQQGAKLVGTGVSGSNSFQGVSVSLSADGNTAMVGGYGDNNGAGASWVYTRSSGIWSQQGAKLVGTGAVGNAQQGFSVSLSADGNTAMASGYEDNSLAGAVWVYTLSGGVWTQQGSKLVGTGAVGIARQGRSVSLSADGNTAMVGGYVDNSNVGAAWVYTRSGAVWTQQGSKLVGTGAVGAANQGQSVTLSADGNMAMVGGYGDNTNIGAAWVYTRSGSTWSQQSTKLIGTGATGAAQQGRSVSLSADGSTAMVGGSADNNFAGAVWAFIPPPPAPVIASFLPTSGAVGTLVTITGNNLDNTTSISIGGTQGIIISNTTTTLVGMVMPGAVTGGISVTTNGGTATASGNFTVTPTPYPGSQQGAKLVGAGATGAAFQGYSIAVSADGNTAIVGGSQDNSAAGAAWVYTRSGGVWSQQGAKLVGTGAIGNASQGQSVSLSADGNTAIVGGFSDNSNAGAAWVYTRSGGVWSQQGSKLVGTGAMGNSGQGISVSLSADGNTAVVGGYLDNSNAGAAWVYTRSGGVWSQQGSKLVGTGAAGAAQQGRFVSLSADGNTAMVGGYADNSNIGAAWVYTRSGGVWSQQGSKLVGIGATGAAQQGRSVAVSADGNTAMVGGIADNGNIGAAWVYTRSGGVWTQQGSKLVGTGVTGSNIQQGISVSLSADGNTAIVGGYRDNSNLGASWVYTRSGGVWSQQGSKLVGTGATAIAFQGYSVSISADGSTAMVGGYINNSNAGAAWAFIPSVVPVITSFSPVSAAAGTTVTITGTNFTDASAVSFGGTAATSFTVVSATSITAVVAAGTTGNVSVTTPGGTGTLAGFSFFSSNASLSAIALSSGTLSPAFASGTISYSASVANATTSITLTPTVSDPGATVTVNGSTVSSGSASGAINLNVGANTITTLVTAPDGTTQKTYTATVTREQASQTITFAALPAQAYGGADFNAGATASSGLAVSYTSSNTAVATVSSSGVVHILLPGTTDITASQAGNANYAAATAVIQTLTVNKASLTITANNQNKAYGAAIPALTVTYAGFVNSETQATLTTLPTLVVTATTASAPGTYMITPSGAAAANYAFNYVSGTLTIGQAGQTITFAATAAKTYGDADFTLGATATSGLAVSYTSSNTSVATVDVSGNVHIVSSGSAVITASQVGDANYAAANPVAPTLTVNKAPLTITADNQNKPYGATNPALTASYTGFVNGDTYTSLTAQPTVSTTATTASAAGAYPITALGATSNNYTIGYTAGTLTIGQASQNLSFASLPAKTYGDVDFNAGATSNNSTIPINYTSSNPLVATVDASGTVHILSAGSTNINSSQPGNANYTAATDVAQNLTVNKALLTITADNQNKPYGAANPALTVSYTGFVNGDTNTSLTAQAVISTSATSASVVGYYPITVNGATSNNYTIAFTTGTLTVVPDAQSITFNSLAAKTYGDADFTISGNSSSGLSVVYTSSDVNIATVTGNTVHILKAGSVTITASQAGNSNYNAAASVQQILTINPASLTITANNQIKTYNTANPVLTLSYSGFVNGNTNASLTTQAIVSTTATGASLVGNYPITVSGAANNNYTITYVNGVLTVGQSTPTVTFNALSAKTYGDADFNLSSSSSSGLPVTYTSSNPLVATVASGTIHIFSAGSTTITASQAGNGNYSPAASIQQILTVNKASLTVTANNQSKTYGSANPALTASYSGFVNGDTNTSLTTQPTIVTTATAASATGTYTITVSGAASNNYNIAYVNGTLSVYPGAQTITFTVQPRTYGDADFSLNATASSGLPVTYSSSNPVVATVDASGIVHIVSAGNVTISAIQPGNGNYIATTTINQQLTINKAALTIAADTLRKVYGAANPPLTLSYIGFVNGDTNTILTTQPIVGTTANAASTVGAYPVTVSGAAGANYLITYRPGMLTVGQNSQTITYASATSVKTYGDADFSLPATSSSGLAIIYTSSNSAVATIDASGTVHVISAGTTTFTASQPGNANYLAAALVTNILTVNKASLTIASANQNKTYGAVNPTLTATYTGFVNGDDNSSLTTLPTFSTTATTGSAVGIYPIVAANATAANYNITYTAGNLNVVKAALTLTADNQTKVGGSGNPPLTVSYSGFINGDTPANLTTQPVIATTAATGSAPGAYPITVSGAASVNYTFNYTAGTLTVTNATVSSVSLAQASLFENRPARTSAGTLSATSLDPNATYTYTLVAGAGSTDNASFSIQGNRLVTAQSLDYEQKANYSITVRAANQYGLYLDQAFTINLSDVNEAPTLAAIGNQSVCNIPSSQTIALTGITPGPETAQTTTVSVSSTNPGLFNQLYVSNITNGAATLTYQLATTGTAVVTVTVKDNGGTANGGIDSFSQTFTLTSNTLPLGVISSDKGTQIAKGETVTLTATGGSVYSWDTAPNVSGTITSQVIKVRPGQTTTYQVKASNASGCSTMASIIVNVVDDYSEIHPANLLTPNGDGKNDTWVVKNLDLYPNNTVSIFDRGGRKLLEVQHYKNDWDGTMNGSPLSEGTYYYVIDFGPGKGALKGFISILRNR